MPTKIYEVVRVEGLGVVESPLSADIAIGELFFDEIDAINRSTHLYLDTVSDKERNSGWCNVNYVVRERMVR